MMRTAINGFKDFLVKLMPCPKIPPSYSQAGEDAVIKFLFNDFGKRKIEYLDLGTNLPDHYNNTYLFL
ncbi:MAG: hypothetical protein IPL84_04185 [Chitinophagaceae bacterium]|nr:hypothetical protein [Chitinophagaceae bacterium]